MEFQKDQKIRVCGKDSIPFSVGQHTKEINARSEIHNIKVQTYDFQQIFYRPLIGSESNILQTFDWI